MNHLTEWCDIDACRGFSDMWISKRKEKERVIEVKESNVGIYY